MYIKKNNMHITNYENVNRLIINKCIERFKEDPTLDTAVVDININIELKLEKILEITNQLQNIGFKVDKFKVTNMKTQIHHGIQCAYYTSYIFCFPCLAYNYIKYHLFPEYYIVIQLDKYKYLPK
jgi:hypothetical protein